MLPPLWPAGCGIKVVVDAAAACHDADLQYAQQCLQVFSGEEYADDGNLHSDDNLQICAETSASLRRRGRRADRIRWRRCRASCRPGHWLRDWVEEAAARPMFMILSFVNAIAVPELLHALSVKAAASDCTFPQPFPNALRNSCQPGACAAQTTVIQGHTVVGVAGIG
jgi:hypothetical protein